MTARAKKVKEFISITGADKSTAEHFLDACSDNLETAVTMFLDDKHETEKSGAACSSSSKDNDEVRAPIPQTSGILVDDPHYNITSNDRWNTRRRPTSVFDGFRDFKTETKQQEELLVSSGRSKRLKRLEDLFRPPLELMHRGTFETARETGKKQCKWLMVNVQNVREFCCQVLNRDVWSKLVVQNQIKKNFIFWQVYNDSTEGDRFMTFYSVNSWPHVSLLDPRTGERLALWNKIDVNNISGKIEEFLADHGAMNEEDSGPPTKKTKLDHSLIDDNEDTQLAAAIAASLKETEAKQKVQDCATISDDDGSDVSGFEASSDEEENKQPSKCNGKFPNGQKVENIANNNNITAEPSNTKIKKKFFPSKTNKISQKSDQIKTKISSKTISSKEIPENCEKLDKIYKKVTVPKTKLGAIKNGKDLSNLTHDKYNNNHKEATKSHSTVAANGSEETCRIMVRFPDGTRDQVELGANLTVKDLSARLTMKGFSSEDYEIVTNFPRKNISATGAGKTLKEVGLFPRATVFVQEREN